MKRPTIQRGDRIRIKPEWRDPGDEEFIWMALEDEHGGRVRIAPVMDLPYLPNQVVTTDMIERDANGDFPDEHTG